MRTFALLCAKNFGFFEIYGVSNGQGERLEPLRTTGEGVNFSRFVRTSFMDGPYENMFNTY